MTDRENIEATGPEPAPEHPQEGARLRELRSLDILDTLPEERFDRITMLAADLFQVSTALVSLVDADRQWFKSACGLDATETPRAVAFCSHAIVAKIDPFVVLDAAQNPRFAGNPLVTGDPGIRFYAGALLRGPSGFPVGTLCIINDTPRRSFGPRDRSRLVALASMVEDELARTEETMRLRDLGS